MGDDVHAVLIAKASTLADDAKAVPPPEAAVPMPKMC